MTLNEKTLAQVVPSTKAVIFTATAKTIVKSIVYTNNTLTAKGITIWADVDGSQATDENVIFAPYLFPSLITVTKDYFIVLDIGGTITAEGTGAGITISGAELT